MANQTTPCTEGKSKGDRFRYAAWFTILGVGLLGIWLPFLSVAIVWKIMLTIGLVSLMGYFTPKTEYTADTYLQVATPVCLEERDHRGYWHGLVKLNIHWSEARANVSELVVFSAHEAATVIIAQWVAVELTDSFYTGKNGTHKAAELTCCLSVFDRDTGNKIGEINFHGKKPPKAARVGASYDGPITGGCRPIIDLASADCGAILSINDASFKDNEQCTLSSEVAPHSSSEKLLTCPTCRKLRVFHQRSSLIWGPWLLLALLLPVILVATGKYFVRDFWAMGWGIFFSYIATAPAIWIVERILDGHIRRAFTCESCAALLKVDKRDGAGKSRATACPTTESNTTSG
jgi:hypothetical protein